MEQSLRRPLHDLGQRRMDTLYLDHTWEELEHERAEYIARSCIKDLLDHGALAFNNHPLPRMERSTAREGGGAFYKELLAWIEHAVKEKDFGFLGGSELVKIL